MASNGSKIEKIIDTFSVKTMFFSLGGYCLKKIRIEKRKYK